MEVLDDLVEVKDKGLVILISFYIYRCDLMILG